MNIGDKVRVLAPFDETCSGEYEITEHVQHGDGREAFILGDLGGFDPKYLGAV